ncbi:homoserine dehydrogenase [Halovulum sp. GXIMD14793]
MTQPLRIAIAGLGTVGAGVVTILQQHRDLLTARAGRPLELVAVSARSRSRDRGVNLDAYDWQDDPVAMARRDDIDLLIEVIGGEDGPAYAATQAALEAGKHVVTANKAMMAAHGATLAQQAESQTRALRFEAAVAGGIPIVKALTEGLAANAISRVMGVMNGTCNYIVTQMEETGASYQDVLADAQRLGYAEADPAFDVGGIDAAQKLALLAATAFATKPDMSVMQIEGIERVTLTDIRFAGEMGFRIKLLGVAAQSDTGVETRMQPCLVPATSPLGQLEGVSNMVVVEGDFIGQTVYQGPGAGAGPTASAVMGDVIDIARGLIIPPFGAPASTLNGHRASGADSPASFYLRFDLADRPGTLAQVAEVLGRTGISINRMRQIDHAGDSAPVIMVTHACTRAELDVALNRIKGLEACLAAPIAYRIEQV